MKRLLAALGVLAILTTSGLGGQNSYDASQDRLLTGTVRVGNGPPAGPAVVTLYNSLHTFLARTGTDGSGSFSFTGVRAGDLLIVVDLAGYEEASVPVRVFPSARVSVVPPIALRPLEATDTLPGSVGVAELELSKRAKKEYDEGFQALAKGKPAEALPHLQRTVKLAPKFAGAERWLGVAQSNVGDFKGAEASFRRAIKLDSNQADFFFGLAKILCLTNRPDEALPVLEQRMYLSPHSSAGLCIKSQIQYLLGNFSLAEQIALQALKESPPPPAEVHLVLANCFLRSRRYPEAAEEVRAYLKLAPNSPNAPPAKVLLNRLEAGLHGPDQAQEKGRSP